METERADTAIRVLRVLKTPLTLLALLVLLFVFFRVGYNWLTAPAPPPTVAPCIQMPITDGELRSEQVSVQVLNAGGERGLAADVSRALESDEFNVTITGNYEGDQPPAGTLIIGADPNNPEVQLVAQHFREPELQGDGRIDRSVEVLLGAEYAGMVDDASWEIAYDQPEICLPEIVEATE
ncbi:LytR C-terminal domain-containing protein [Naumannella halotolerans]|uniref:LytR C-terminal domain-containing protein n=1 Tax=Naumannella halotolerans TaxID=993414 RepID=UPI00370D6BDE